MNNRLATNSYRWVQKKANNVGFPTKTLYFIYSLFGESGSEIMKIATLLFG